MPAMWIQRRCVRLICLLYRDPPRVGPGALIARLDVRGEMPRPKKKTEPPATPECPLTDIDARHATYEALLGQLSLASDHQENLLSRGLSLEMIQELGYKTTPVIGMTAIAKHLQEAGYYLSGVPGFYRKDGKWRLCQRKAGGY